MHTGTLPGPRAAGMRGTTTTTGVATPLMTAGATTATMVAGLRRTMEGALSSVAET